MSKDIRPRFWELPLAELTATEWEMLCDGCGRCCVKKLEDEANGEVYFTRIICRFFDQRSSRCRCYESRSSKVPDCLQVDTLDWRKAHWVPATCAYRLRQEGKPLYDWHPLLAGNREQMEAADIAVAGRVITEDHVHPDSYEEHIIRWISS